MSQTREEDETRAGAYWNSQGVFGVAVAVKYATKSGGFLVAEMTADEMVEMAEHLLVNARRSRARAGLPRRRTVSRDEIIANELREVLRLLDDAGEFDTVDTRAIRAWTESALALLAASLPSDQKGAR